MKNTKKVDNIDKINNAKLGAFADMDKKRRMQFGGAQSKESQTTAGVINDYSKKKPYGQPGGPSYMPTTPAPAFKKGGAKKK